MLGVKVGVCEGVTVGVLLGVEVGVCEGVRVKKTWSGMVIGLCFLAYTTGSRMCIPVARAGAMPEISAVKILVAFIF